MLGYFPRTSSVPRVEQFSICFGLLSHLHIFSAASNRLHVFVSSFDWFFGLPVFFVICVSDYFGFELI